MIVSANTANGYVLSHLQDVPNPVQQIQMDSPAFLLLQVLQALRHLFIKKNSAGAQIVFFALVPQQTSDAQRNPAVPALGSPYKMMMERSFFPHQ